MGDSDLLPRRQKQEDLSDGCGTLYNVGLWLDTPVAPLRAFVTFVHSQSQKLGMQLGDTGREVSPVPLWLALYAVISKAPWR